MTVDYKKILARIAEKWPAKVLSVVVAIFLFTFHRMGELQERLFSLPLRIDLHSNLTPGSSYPRNVRVSLRGDADSLYLVTEDDFEAYVDFSAYSEPGTYKAPVRIQKKGASAEMETLEISSDPMELSLELDTKISKYVPLTPNFQGYLESGYEMVSYILEPNQVVIDGPMKLLVNISELATEAIDLNSRNADFSSRLRIMNPNPLLIIRGDGMTEFSGFIRELIMIKSFDDLPIETSGLDENLEAVLNPPAASVRLHGVQELLDSPEAAPVLSVDCSSIDEPGTYTLPLVVTAAAELTVDRLEPETIEILVTLKEGEEE
jgi:YbbR domain-containing protein